MIKNPRYSSQYKHQTCTRDIVHNLFVEWLQANWLLTINSYSNGHWTTEPNWESTERILTTEEHNQEKAFR